jgi:DNA helicase-2/ATP-dependent DNA helicase PcrA
MKSKATPAFIILQPMKEEVDLLAGLNPPQKEGVTTTEGPVMIIAGAGSGKTRVLTYRIAYLMREKGVDPFRILALTFTNKAAAEMRERIEKVVGPEARNLWMGTFHSVFARILRTEGHYLGYSSNFTIYDTDDSKSLIRSIVKERGLDDKTYKANTVLNRISSAKNSLISWQQYQQNSELMEQDAMTMRPEIGNLYQAYVERCFKSGAMDFDDLLFNTNVLFKRHTDVLNKYQQRFQYVLVDEFQDTNLSQYLITKRLSAAHRNICVVGDDAQSIYAFRGADIRNILNFEKDFSELKIIKLEQNYRSTQTIVEAANSVIGKNKAQLQKNVWTANESGEYISLLKAASDNEEGRLVATSIFEQKTQHKLRNLDFAILYRTNSQSRAMEEALRKMNIKYKIIGGLSFYQRKEIKDLMAYLRFTVNTNDEQALRRIINYPKRGIGDASVDKIIVAADDHGTTLWEVLEHIHEILPGRAANAVENFAMMIKSFQVEVRERDAYEAALEIAKGCGLLKELYADRTVEGLNRYENVQELLNSIKEYVDNKEIEDKSLSAFLQEIALLTSADEDKDQDPDKVTLMTIHMAKGLEFKQVYVVGMEEDLFPSQMMLSSRADLEEERRLFYVAITRAQKKLTLSYALSRYRFGRLKNCDPSRFLEDIDPNYLKVDRKFSGNMPQMSSSHYARNLVRNLPQSPAKATPRFSTAQAAKRSENFEASDTSTLAAGMKVEHPKFGEGEVMHIQTDGANRKATVRFTHFGEKTLLLSFAKLRIIA